MNKVNDLRGPRRTNKWNNSAG